MTLRENNWWPSEDEYHPGIDKEQWKLLWENSDVFDDNSKTVISCYSDFKNGATCTQVSQKYGKNSGFYNIISTKLAKRIITSTDCNVLEDNNENARFWPIIYVGKRATKDEDGSYIWKLRHELREALEEIGVKPSLETTSKPSQQGAVMEEKNIILYGPPGTGKTYNTVRYAVSIIEDKPLNEIYTEEYSVIRERYLEHKKNGLIAFTTFHQSYGYEDFIEGIRPIMASEEDTEENKDLKYEVHPGVFKEFCWNAERGTYKSNDDIFDASWDKLIASGKENNNTYNFTRRTGTVIETKLINDFKFRVNWQSEQGSHNDFNKEAVRQQWLSDINREKFSGGGRFMFDARQAIIDEMERHFELHYNSDNARKNHIFIIDEINRGNISKIFGELITLIEPSKRVGEVEELKTILPYSNDNFGVPNNVYIVGTMNTADRSIAMMDTALRRRFEFIEVRPDSDEIRKRDIVVEGIDIANLLDTMNKRIQVLHDREHTIGHSFFLVLENDCTIKRLAKIFEKKIIPLLQEYFYDDYDKICLVLGDNQKSDKNLQFVIKENIDRDLFGNVGDDSLDDAVNYYINHDAFMKVEAYGYLK
ncbi:MAG: AAA family ATPase [Oscillospiraceae bacterium]|nr:AAA family ATPase [Oscillospiraceae bacterium]